MMKVFLANAPWTKPGFYGVRAGSRWPHFESSETSDYMPFPFFLGYATALLKANGFDAQACDAAAERIDEATFMQRLKEASPDLILFEVSTASMKVDTEIALRARECVPGVRIAFAGIHEPMYDAKYLDDHPELDFALIGEYEHTLLALARALDDGIDLAGIAGLNYRGPDGPVSNGRAPLVNDLQAFPWPDRDSLPMHSYCDLPGGIPAPSLQMWGSRGCPFQCNFCAWPQIMYGSNKYRVRDPEDIVKEIMHCVDKYGFKSVYFDDDTFNIGKARLLKLAKAMHEHGFDLPWAMMARADTTDRETLEALRDAGLVALKYGVESGDQEVVTRAQKNLDLNTLRKAVQFTKELGIKIHLTFTFGLPGETRLTAMKTIDLALELAPDTLQFSIATPFPGSRFYEEVKGNGHLLSDDYDEYDGYNRAVVRTDELSPRELEEILRLAQRRWAKFERFRRVRSAPMYALSYAVRNPARAWQLLTE